MSRAHAVLGQAIAPRVGFANSHPRKPRVGQHLPNARENWLECQARALSQASALAAPIGSPAANP